MDMEYKAALMSSEDILRALKRISHQIIEKNRGLDKVCLVGIKTRGVPLARRLAAIIGDIEGTVPPVGELDITLYRDDLSRISETPKLKGSSIDFSIEEMTVVLVDDVIYTARTARAALEVTAHSESMSAADRIRDKIRFFIFTPAYLVFIIILYPHSIGLQIGKDIHRRALQSQAFAEHLGHIDRPEGFVMTRVGIHYIDLFVRGIIVLCEPAVHQYSCGVYPLLGAVVFVHARV